MKFILISAFFIFCNSSNALRDDFKLELVQVLFRHGDRVPDKIEVYKTDPYDPVFYKPYGYGQLTKVGMQREYQIGQMLRQRYNYFLADYNVDEVYAYSTDYDRTKMSLQLVLNGLYPLTAKTRWNKYILWHPIPTHYKPMETDFLLFDLFGRCSGGYSKLLSEAEKSPEVQKRYKKYEDFVDYLRNKTGISSLRPFTAILISTNLRCALSLGLPLPEWCSAQDYEKLQDILSLGFDTLAQTELMRKLAIGPTIYQFLENMRNSERTDSNRKIYLYGAHDINIAVFNRAHNFTGIPLIPDYGSAIIMEKLRNRNNNQVYIRMLLWTGVSEKMIPLKLKNCGYECLLSDYIEIVKSIVVDDNYKKCTTSTDIISRTTQTRTHRIKIDSNLMLTYLFAGEDLYSFKYADEMLS